MSSVWLQRHADRIAGGALAGFGIFWIIAAARQSYFVDTPYVSLSFLPMAGGAILTLLSAFVVLRPTRPEAAPDAPADAAAADTARPRASGGLLRAALAIVALLAYAILLPRVHSLLTTFGLLVVGLALSGEPLRPKLLLIAAFAALLLYGIFVIWLGVPLPGGRYT